MQSITVKRYSDPNQVGWAGFLEPADRSWVAFVDLAGRPTFFLTRDASTGVVLPDDPTESATAISRLRWEERRAAAWTAGESFSDGDAPPIVYARVIHDSGRYVGRMEDGFGLVPPAAP